MAIKHFCMLATIHLVFNILQVAKLILVIIHNNQVDEPAQ